MKFIEQQRVHVEALADIVVHPRQQLHAVGHFDVIGVQTQIFTQIPIGKGRYSGGKMHRKVDGIPIQRLMPDGVENALPGREDLPHLTFRWSAYR